MRGKKRAERRGENRKGKESRKNRRKIKYRTKRRQPATNLLKKVLNKYPKLACIFTNRSQKPLATSLPGTTFPN